jgi:hypothetical protein
MFTVIIAVIFAKHWGVIVAQTRSSRDISLPLEGCFCAKCGRLLSNRRKSRESLSKCCVRRDNCRWWGAAMACQ